MPQPPDFPYDVFLSHNHADKPRVRRLAERLKAAALRVWFDEWNIPKAEGKRMKDESELHPSSFTPHPLLDQGLEQSRVLLLCISPNALASGWVAVERSTAIHRDAANEGRRFIPLLLDGCDVPDTLRR